MNKTISEKIIQDHTEKEVIADDIVVSKVDFCFSHDASGPLVISRINEMGGQIFNPKKTVFFIDHAVPSSRFEISNEQSKLRNFVKKSGAILSEAGGGICHQVMVEKYVNPGNLIVGADSHSVMGGALGAFSIGMGATDTATAMTIGKIWLKVPKTYKVVVTGKLKNGVYSKDIILNLINTLGSDGADYKAIEFHGKVISNMDMDQRFTLSNMVIESGAKAGLIPSDNVTLDYLKKVGRSDQFKKINSDDDAIFDKIIEIDGDMLKPLIALPHSVDNVKPVKDVEGIKIDTVFIGSCTNSRLSDLHVAASILRKNKIKTRLIVTPSSQKVYNDSLLDGTLDVFIKAGAVVTPPGCGMCFGALGGIPADDEKVLTTTNRNFKGRTGNPNSYTYLASPATAAVTAIEGKITDPSDYV